MLLCVSTSKPLNNYAATTLVKYLMAHSKDTHTCTYNIAFIIKFIMHSESFSSVLYYRERERYLSSYFTETARNRIVAYIDWFEEI